MEKPSPTFSSEIVHVVSSFSATMPCPPNWAESAMVNQPACAAASSSSGFVPTPLSKRVLKEYCVCFRTPLSVEIAPLPVFKSPCQTAEALRCISFSPLHICVLFVPSIGFAATTDRYKDFPESAGIKRREDLSREMWLIERLIE